VQGLLGVHLGSEDGHRMLAYAVVVIRKELKV
jgi:hypothetical protein